LVLADANDYVKTKDKLFELIIIDLFIGNEIPILFTKYPFISQLTHLLNKDGNIIFNTMRETTPLELLNSIQNSFDAENMQVENIANLESLNDLLIIESKKKPNK